jgi:uncharacterized membrane protein
METSLRPLTLGEILDRTAQLYRSHFWLFSGIASVYSGALLLLNLLAIGVQQWLSSQHLQPNVTNRYLLLAGGMGLVLQMFVMFAVGGLAVAANNRAVAWVHLGEPATIRRAWASIMPKAGRYLWLMTIIWFVLWFPMALAYGGYIAALFRWVGAGSIKMLSGGSGTPPNQQAALMFLLVTMAFGLVFLLASAWAIVMGLRYALAIAACVVENLPARPAIRRSIVLSKGARGRIFVLGLLVAVIQIGLVLITQLLFIVLTLKQHGQLAPGARIAQQLVAFVTNTFIGPIYATGLTLFYYDQRVRKEGYDIEWMMQAAGLTLPASVDSPELTAAPPAPLPDQTEHA